MRVVSNVQALATGFRLHYVCAVSDFLLGLSRFIAVFAASKLGGGLDAMLMLYAFTSLPGAIVTYAWMVRRYGSPHWRGGGFFTEFRDHQRMVVAWFSEMAAREGDKPLLLALSTPAQTGIYGTATKLFLVCIVPIDLLTQVFRPRVGQAYGDGEVSGKRTGRLMTITLFGIGALTTVGMLTVLLLLPRFVPQLMNSHFADARVALIYLAFLPPVYGLQRAAVITAISRGTTGIYATSTALSAVMSASTILLLAPTYGWRGACAGLLVYLASSSAAIHILAHFAQRKALKAPAIEPISLAEQIDESLAELTGGVSVPIQ
jgi:O-antigen/teichoic acid export membrane protein